MDCGYKNWIGGWGLCELWKKNSLLILLISTQNLYFVDDDAIYDVIIQFENDVITTDMKSAGIH